MPDPSTFGSTPYSLIGSSRQTSVGQQINGYRYIAMRAAIGFRTRRRLTRNLPRYKTRWTAPSTTPTTVPMILTIFKIASPPPPLSQTPLTL
jgi:hypothetical protein